MVVGRTALSLAARAMSRLARRSGTWTPPVIPSGPFASIPHGKLASPSEPSFWRDSVFVGESGNLYRVVLSPPRHPSDVVNWDSEDEIPGCMINDEQLKQMVPADGLILSTIRDGQLEQHVHSQYRGQQGIRLPSQQFPLVPQGDAWDGFWPRLQIVTFPLQGRCTFTLYDGEAKNHWVDTSVNLRMIYATSCNAGKKQNFPDPSLGLLYEETLTRELFSSMILRRRTSGCEFTENDRISKCELVKVYLSKKPEGIESSSKTSKGLLQGLDVALEKHNYNSGAEPMEAHVGKQIFHENVRTFYAFFRETETVAFVALEFCKRSLKEFGQCGFEFEIAQRLQMFLQILNGSKACEEKGICHREIRLENILLNDTGTAKLSGFYHAAIAQGDSSIPEGNSKKSKGKSKSEGKGKSEGRSSTRLFPSLSGKGAANIYSPPELCFDQSHSAMVVPYTLGSVYYYLMSSSAHPYEALQKFLSVARTGHWKNMKSAWRAKKLSDDWHGDEDLIFGMFQPDAKLRLSIDELIARVRKQIQGLRTSPRE